MMLPPHHVSACEVDGHGQVFPICSCGWSFGPVAVMSHARATDLLMEHARLVGMAEMLPPSDPLRAAIDREGIGIWQAPQDK